MVALTPDQMKQVEEELIKRKELIGTFPPEIRQKIDALGIQPGKVEIQIQKRNGLFVNIKQ